VSAITTRTRGGNETILVVEDEPVLRDLARLILKEQGYRVLEAASGVEALRVWQDERRGIDLLLTDMVMPEGMSGRELADKLKTDKPSLKVICVSGYNVEEVNQPGVVFLQKPYTRLSLARVVRDCLDR
jgi:two-component system cell cycle sensor histidine kinase/response regulator CckA